MKKNKMKISHSSSFGRLWSYLQAYRFPLYLAIFLKIVSVIMSVLEPVVIGLAITELTKIRWPSSKVWKALISTSPMLVWFWLFISCVVLFMSWLPTIPTIS